MDVLRLNKRRWKTGWDWQGERGNDVGLLIEGRAAPNRQEQLWIGGSPENINLHGSMHGGGAASLAAR